MSAVAFITDLVETGRVRVGLHEEFPSDLTEAVIVLERLARPEMPLEPPGASIDAATWALSTFYQACRFLVYREIGADDVRQALAVPCPRPPSPEVCYGVDLSFRYLPDLLNLARGVARDDPLVAALIDFARQWPLSSVGVNDVPAQLDVAPFIAHPSLRRLYVDRVIERGDLSRLRHPLVREAAREAIGAFPELAPDVARAIATENEASPTELETA